MYAIFRRRLYEGINGRKNRNEVIFEYDELKKNVEEDFERFYKMKFNEK